MFSQFLRSVVMVDVLDEKFTGENAILHDVSKIAIWPLHYITFQTNGKHYLLLITTGSEIHVYY